MFFWWGCTSFHFLIHIINSNSSPKLLYSNIFLFNTFFLRFICSKKTPIWSLIFLEDILILLTRMSIPSLPHSYYQLDFISYTYVFQSLPLHYWILHFLIYSFNVTFSVTLRSFNLFLFTIFPFTYLFVLSTLIFLLPLCITISSS